MYGTIARLQLKPGMQQQLIDFGLQEDGLGIPGYIGEFVYQMDSDANEHYLVVLFESKETYAANAQDPAQDARYQQLRELLTADPEWHDGTIVHSYLTPTALQ